MVGGRPNRHSPLAQRAASAEGAGGNIGSAVIVVEGGRRTNVRELCPDPDQCGLPLVARFFQAAHVVVDFSNRRSRLGFTIAERTDLNCRPEHDGSGRHPCSTSRSTSATGMSKRASGCGKSNRTVERFCSPRTAKSR